MRAQGVGCATALRPVTVPRILFHKFPSVFINAIFNQGEKKSGFLSTKIGFLLEPPSIHFKDSWN